MFVPDSHFLGTQGQTMMGRPGLSDNDPIRVGNCLGVVTFQASRHRVSYYIEWPSQEVFKSDVA